MCIWIYVTFCSIFKQYIHSMTHFWGLDSVEAKLWMVLCLRFLFLTLIHLNFFPFGCLEDRDRTQKQDSSAPVCAASEPPRRFEEPSRQTNKSSRLKCKPTLNWNSLLRANRTRRDIYITLDLGMRPTLKNPICPVSILVQSTTVDAMFSGEAPSHNTPST